jgi:hypothetical protein
LARTGPLGIRANSELLKVLELILLFLPLVDPDSSEPK